MHILAEGEYHNIDVEVNPAEKLTAVRKDHTVKEGGQLQGWRRARQLQVGRFAHPLQAIRVYLLGFHTPYFSSSICCTSWYGGLVNYTSALIESTLLCIPRSIYVLQATNAYV